MQPWCVYWMSVSLQGVLLIYAPPCLLNPVDEREQSLKKYLKHKFRQLLCRPGIIQCSTPKKMLLPSRLKTTEYKMFLRGEIPDGPVIRSLCFHCWAPEGKGKKKTQEKEEGGDRLEHKKKKPFTTKATSYSPIKEPEQLELSKGSKWKIVFSTNEKKFVFTHLVFRNERRKIIYTSR